MFVRVMASRGTEIGKKVCGGEYNEEVVKKKVDRVLVGKDGGIKILFV